MLQFDNYFLEICNQENFQADYEKFFADIKKSKTKIAGKPLPTVFHPLVLSESEYNYMKEISEKMAEILHKTVRLYLENSEVEDFFKFSPTLKEWIKIDPGYSFPFPICRYDAFYAKDKYKFCEFNTDGTSGMNEVNTLEEIFLNTNTGKKLQNKFSLEKLELRKTTLNAILKNYQEFSVNKNLSKEIIPNLAIVDFKESATISEFEVLRDTFIKCGIPTEICDPRELEYRDGNLWHKNFKIDLIYRRAVTDELLENKEDITSLLQAYQDGAVCMVGPLRSQIVHSKLIFTFLSDPLAEKYFTKEEIEFIKTHIPWTRRLTTDSKLIEKILHNKDSYVLKPHNSYGSQGVFSGTETNEKDWSEELEKLLESGQYQNYLVQEKIELPQKRFIVDPQGNTNSFKVSIAPYIFNSKLRGFYTRISNVDVITTNLGGKIIPLFVAHSSPA